MNHLNQVLAALSGEPEELPYAASKDFVFREVDVVSGVLAGERGVILDVSPSALYYKVQLGGKVRWLKPVRLRLK